MSNQKGSRRVGALTNRIVEVIQRVGTFDVTGYKKLDTKGRVVRPTISREIAKRLLDKIDDPYLKDRFLKDTEADVSRVLQNALRIMNDSGVPVYVVVCNDSKYIGVITTNPDYKVYGAPAHQQSLERLKKLSRGVLDHKLERVKVSHAEGEMLGLAREVTELVTDKISSKEMARLMVDVVGVKALAEAAQEKAAERARHAFLSISEEGSGGKPCRLALDCIDML